MVFELMYMSVLAPATDVRSLADIVRRSRSYNRLNGLTGILAFDGQRFCQHIEGDREAVMLLAEKIAADRRHHQLRILHQGFVGTERRFGDWSMAYALDTTGAVLDALVITMGPRAVVTLQVSSAGCIQVDRQDVHPQRRRGHHTRKQQHVDKGGLGQPVEPDGQAITRPR